MKLASVIAAATLLAGSAASAQLAFITQIGDDNTAVNISERTAGNNGTLEGAAREVQVIAQVGNNLDAANVSRGRDNLAYNFQFAGSVDGFATSLIYQDGPEENGGIGNVAVNFQSNPGGGALMGAQTVQFGSNNTAINWMDSRGDATAGAIAPVVEMPTLGVEGVTFNAPFSVTGAVVPFGSATAGVLQTIQQQSD